MWQVEDIIRAYDCSLTRIKREYIEQFGYTPEMCERLMASTLISPHWKEFDRGVLTDEEVKHFLHEKWITPVQRGIIATASEVVESLIKQVEALASKYAVSYNDLNAELVTAQDELSNLISDLTGDEYAIRGLNEFKNSNEFNAMQLTSARQKGNQMRSYSAKPLARQEKSAARIAIGDSAAGRPYPQRG